MEWNGIILSLKNRYVELGIWCFCYFIFLLSLQLLALPLCERDVPLALVNQQWLHHRPYGICCIEWWIIFLVIKFYFCNFYFRCCAVLFFRTIPDCLVSCGCVFVLVVGGWLLDCQKSTLLCRIVIVQSSQSRILGLLEP